jgi:hypothetical protein
VIVEREIVFVIYEVKYVGVGAGELCFHLLAKGVVPNEPVAHKKAKLVSYDFYVGGVLIADGYIE